MKIFYFILYPGIVVFNGTANAFTRLLGIPPASETEEALGEREIRRVLARSGEQGDIDVEEVAMIERVFDLDDTVVREVMVPRPDVVSVSAASTFDELRTIVFEAGHTRYPVLDGDDGDQVVDYVDVKDVLRTRESAKSVDVAVGDITRDVAIVPETMTINDLLLQFREDHQQMAAVIDEWGSFEGIATVEDVIEAIVGDLQDDFDVADREPSIRERDSGGYDVDGSVPLSTVNETLDADFEHEAVETIGGLVLGELNRAPEFGDTVELQGYTIEVTAVDGARISTVRVVESDPGDTPIK